MPDTGASNYKYWWDKLLEGGKNPLGKSGINLDKAIAGYQSGRSNGRIDPRLQALGDMEFTGSEAGSDVGQWKSRDPRVDGRGYIDGDWAQIGDFTSAGHDGRIIDYSKLKYDPDYGILTQISNIKPDKAAENGDLALFLAGGAALAAPALAAAAGGGLAGAEGANVAFDFSAMPALEPTTVGSFGPAFELPAAGAAGAGGLSGLGEAASAGEFVGPPASSMPIGAEPMGALPSTQVGSLGPGFNANPSLLQQAGNYISRNPGQVGRAALGLASLGAAGGSGGGGGGASTDANSIIEQMARANRVNHTTPIGSRTWSQDANGQWSVNDSMSPVELANFQNVQGLNASTTEAARQRLAALLSAKPAPRADRPLGG